MNTTVLTEKDFKQTPWGLVYEEDFECEGNLVISGEFLAQFAKSVKAGGFIDAGGSITAGGFIKAGWFIKAGGSITADGAITADGSIKAGGSITADGLIKSGGFITAGGFIDAGGSITAGGFIKAGWFIKAGGSITADGAITADGSIKAGGSITADGLIKSGGSITADGAITADGSIKAGGSITAGEGVISFRGGVRAETLSCLRVAVGYNRDTDVLIEANVEKGDVLLGKVASPNPPPKQKWYWHIHHEVLVEKASEPIENRIQYIKKKKPECEVETRLRLLHEVQDVDTLKLAMETGDYEMLETLHRKECPNCPWNGETIFP